MQSFFTMLQLQGLLFVYMLIGYFLKKRGLLTQQAVSGLTNLLIDILLPCTIFDSFNQQLTVAQFREAGLILLVGIGVGLLAVPIGKVLFCKYPEAKQTILRFATIIPNGGFAGIPLAGMAYGEIGLFYGAVFVIPIRFFNWSIGLSIFTKSKGMERIKKMFCNPGIIAIMLGLCRMLLAIPIPAFVDTAVGSIADSTTVISLITIGAILADVDVKTVLHVDTLYLSAVRLVLMPLIAYIACRAIGIDPIASAIGVLITGMPAGSMTAILAQKYGADASFACKCIFVSTVLSLITIPIFFMFL